MDECHYKPEIMKHKILLISGPSPIDFAGVAAMNIYNMLKQNGHEVKILTKYSFAHEEDIIGYYRNRKAAWHQITNRVLRKVQKIFFAERIFSYKKEYHVLKQSSVSANKVKRIIGFKPNIIFIIFHHGFMSHKHIYNLSKTFEARIVWQLVDMGSFTGGCHYSWECNAYRTDCSFCPAAKQYLSRKRIKKRFRLRETYSNLFMSSLDITVGSNWLLEKAKESTLLKNHPIHKVYLSVDLKEFPAKTKNISLQAKKHYNIDPESFVISFGSQSINDKRKGIKYIVETISKLPELPDLTFLVFGSHSTQVKKYLSGRKVICLDAIPRKELSSFYSASDVFLNCSLQDVGPYTLIEALVSNTHVISFHSGFAEEFINDINDIQLLVNLKDTDTMAKSTLQLYNLWKSAELKDVPNLKDIRQIVNPHSVYDLYRNIFQSQTLQ